MNDGAGDIRKRGQEIGHQPFAEGIVFDDRAEKQVFIDLVGIQAADDGVVVFLQAVG
jgi:hypothetical protein